MRLSLVSMLAAVALFGSAPRAASAAVVTGSFALYGPIDWGASDPVPAPVRDGTPGPALGGQFSYDTDAATVLRQTDIFGRYLFDHAASLSLFYGGDVYSTTASLANPLEIDVSGGVNNDHFAIFPVNGRGDSTNPFPAYPRLSMALGFGVFANPQLPTASFAGCCFGDGAYFEDPELFLASEAPPGPVGYYSIRFRLSGDVTIATVPEPVWPTALWLAAIGAVRLRQAGNRRPRM
jgi:hypothetical protein